MKDSAIISIAVLVFIGGILVLSSMTTSLIVPETELNANIKPIGSVKTTAVKELVEIPVTAAEPKAAEPKAAEPTAAEPKAAEPKAAEPKTE